MSTLVFKSPEAAPNDTEISGVGVLQAGGKNSIPIDQAAVVLHELQEHNDDGSLVVVDAYGRGKPLEGKELEAAAKAWAESRGIEVVSMTDKKLDKESAEAAGLLDDLPSPVEVGRAAFVSTFGEEAAPVEETKAAEPAAADEGGKS